MRHPIRSLATATALAAAALVLSRTALAGDPPPDPAAPINDLLAKVETAKTAKDDGALSELMKKVPPLYKGTQDDALRESLRKALGAALKNAKMPESRKCALAALVETEDGAKAWGTVQPVFPKPEAEDADNWHIQVVDGVGALHPEAAVPMLIDLIKKAKQAALCGAAVRAFGGYHTSKQKVQHLEDLVKATKLLVPARAPGKKINADEQAKWGVVGPEIGKALDALTGQRVGDPTEWFKKIDATKDLKTLFKD